MTISLRNPTSEQLNAAIDEIGRHVISREWRDNAFSAVNSWIRGKLESSPYGRPFGSPGEPSTYPEQTRLTVSWEWEDGELTVEVSK